MKSLNTHIVILLLMTSIISSTNVSADNRSNSEITLMEPNVLDCISDITYKCAYTYDSVSQHSFTIPLLNGDSAEQYNINLRIEDLDTGQAVYDSSSDNSPFLLSANEEAQANWSNPFNGWYDGHTYNFTFYALLTDDNQQIGNSHHFVIQFFDNIDVAILSNATNESRLERVKSDLEAMGKTYTQFQVHDWDEYATLEWLEHYNKVLLPWQTEHNVYYGDYYYKLDQNRASHSLTVTETLEEYMTGGGTVQLHLGPYKSEYQPNRLPFGIDLVMRNQVSADVDNRIHYTSLDIVDQYHPILNNVSQLSFGEFNGGSYVALAGLDATQVQANQMPNVCGGRINNPTGTFHTLVQDSENESQSLLSLCNKGAGGLIVTTIDVENPNVSEEFGGETRPILSNLLAYHHTPYPTQFGIAGEGFELTINGQTQSIDSITASYLTKYINSNSELDFSFVTTVEDVVADWTLESGNDDQVTGWDGELMEAGEVSHAQQLDSSIPIHGSFCVDDSSSSTGCRIGAEWLLTLYLHDDEGHTRITYINLVTDDILADEFRPTADLQLVQNSLTDEYVTLAGTKTVGGTDWPIYQVRLTESGDISLSFDSSASSDDDAPEGERGIEMFEYRVFFDFPVDTSSPTLESHTFQIPNAAGGDMWNYVFRNITSDGTLENQIRLELIVFDEAGKSSEKHRMYFIIVAEDFGDDPPVVEITSPRSTDSQSEDLVTINGVVTSGAENGVVIEVALDQSVLDLTPSPKATQKALGKYNTTGPALLGDGDIFTITLNIADLYLETTGKQVTVYWRVVEGDGSIYTLDNQFTIYLMPRFYDGDGDGWSNDMENLCGTDPSNSTDYPLDTDNDGTCNSIDDDDDDDGYSDLMDVFPLDSSEWLDTDSDGVGNNADDDDDGDSWNDTAEELCFTGSLNFTSVPTDTDLDGICNVVDDDDDNDGWDDTAEELCFTGSLNFTSVPTDTDLDGICNVVDDDDDNDGWDDSMDIRPLDPTIQTEWDILRDYLPWGLASIILIVILFALTVLRNRLSRVYSVPEKKVENSAMEDYIQQMIAMGHPEEYARNYAMQFADQFEHQSKNQ